MEIKLDIGCGYSKREGFSGVDILKTDQADYIMDVQHLDFPDNSIDEIYTRRCIQHVPNDILALHEIYRVLKPNAYATIEVASWYGWLYWKLGLGINRFHHYSLFHLYRHSTFKRKLQQTGFRNITIDHVPSVRGIGYDLKAVVQK